MAHVFSKITTLLHDGINTKHFDFDLTYYHGQCFLNAYINQRHHYANKNLRVVVGGFAINGWWEYGGKRWTTADYKRKTTQDSSDSHCWLEDEDGNIYDNIFEEYNFWADIRTGKPSRYTGVVEGWSKAKLKRLGIEYQPAPYDAQLYILNAVAVRNAFLYRMLGEGKGFPLPDGRIVAL